MKAWPLILALLLLLPTAANAYEVGIYQPCPYPGECDPARWLPMARNAGFNAVLVEVVDSNGRALYNSSVLPMADYVYQGYVRDVMRVAKELGMKVYAWVNLPHAYWLEEHPEWVVVYSNGVPASNYTDDYFYRVVSPARVVRECSETLRTLFHEIASMGFDGIDVNDNFQFPDWELGDLQLTSSFDEFTVRAFESDTGLTVPGDGPEEWADYILSNYRNEWERWKMEQVSSLIEMIRDFVYEVRPQPIRPHLLIWDPEVYGLNYSQIAEITGHLYYMVPETETREMHLEAAGRRFGEAEVIASTYLFRPEAWRRAVWLHDADSLFIFDYPLVEERGLWNEVDGAIKGFENAKVALEKVGGLRGMGAVSIYVDPWEGVPLEEVEEALDSGARLIELDVGLSDYEVMYDDNAFSSALAIVEAVSRTVHERNGTLVVYVPALEVDSWGPWFSQDHPEWLQVSLDGRRLWVRGLDVPWLDPEAEVAWVSPFSPHREVVERRVRELIRAGADGIWLDVPHLPSYITDEMDDLWPDASPKSTELFSKGYGVGPPRSVDWDDESFHYWLEWRHKMTLDFVLNITDAAMAEGGFLMVESSSLDYGANEQGFDPSYLLGYPYLAYVPEVEPPWNSTLEEWGHYFAMLKHARASTRGAVLPLTYGLDEDNSARQLGFILPLFGNFFETDAENGLMTGSVGREFRERAFKLLGLMANMKEVRPKVALLFSRNTRDHFDGYVWGPYEMNETVHMAAFRKEAYGLMKMHVPFDVVVIEEAEDLNEYEVVIAPELRCLGERERDLLLSYDGTLLRIGELGDMDEYGVEEVEGLDIGDEDFGVLQRYSVGELPEWVAAIPVSVDGAEGLVVINLTGENSTLDLQGSYLVLDFSGWRTFYTNGTLEAPKTFYILLEPSGEGGRTSGDISVGEISQTVVMKGGRSIGSLGVFDSIFEVRTASYGPITVVESGNTALLYEWLGGRSIRLQGREVFGSLNGKVFRLPPQLLWIIEKWLPIMNYWNSREG